MDLEELQKQIEKEMNEQNNRMVPDFEGYSPFEMHHILHFTFGANSPIQMQKLNDTDYKKIPILNQVKYLTDVIAKNGEIKLTNKGYLPTKIVSDLYNQGFMKEEHIENGISKLYKETDSITINLTRLLIELAGLVKKRTGKLSLTKNGEKLIHDDFQLLKTILEAFTLKFNWPYYDGYGDNQIGQLGYGFSLILLSKYGQEKRMDSFYAEKYFNAYPQLLNSIEPTYGTFESNSTRCYSIRTFDRFLDYFGLVEIHEEGKRFDYTKYVAKTALFDKLIKIRPHSEVAAKPA
ncbi:MAG: hypothetical protein PHU27_04500 [Salinivirgaceae bacterium]|nr:hypothetical protein [Salinivirgaceae bacterium]MDD4746339.1 hypothetical protein [Salinivirgaceae bacterium]MDY0280360.1 hypothetical protein [Salinivirgaceae bacterium]